MQRIARWIETISEWLSGRLQGWVLLGLMALVLVDVVSRYVLQSPLSVAEEFGGYALVAITCLGLAYAWQGGSHVRVEFLINFLPARFRNWLRVFTLVLALALTVLMTLASFELVSFSFLFETRSGSWLRTPVAYPQMALVGGSLLLLLQLLVELGRAIGAARGAREDA